MTDLDLTALRRASEAEPTDAGKRAALEQAWLRAGLGWHGETLPGDSVRDPWFVLPDSERGVYRFATQGNVIKLVYVPGGEVPCERCGGRGRVADTTYGHEVCTAAGCNAGRVKIAPFLIGRFPVTWGEYLAFCSSTGALRPPIPDGFASPLYSDHLERDRWIEAKPRLTSHPVTSVTHSDALAFCSWAGLRLPTAAEWRWAALGDGEGEWVPPGRYSMNGHRARRRFPWDRRDESSKPPTPERCAAADPRYRGRSTAPVVVVERKDVPVGSGLNGRICRVEETLVPARPAGASWCGAHDLVGNVCEIVANGDALGLSFKHGAAFKTRVWDRVPYTSPQDDVGFRVALSAAP